MEFSPLKKSGNPIHRVAQEVIEKYFPVCPQCRQSSSRWTLKFLAEFTDGRVAFRCGCCGSVYSITTADLTGFSKLSKSKNVLLKAYTWQAEALNAVNKTLKGKRASETYIRIESIGDVKCPSFQVGQEVPLDDIRTDQS